jgi:hypothetical protein
VLGGVQCRWSWSENLEDWCQVTSGAGKWWASQVTRPRGFVIIGSRSAPCTSSCSPGRILSAGGIPRGKRPLGVAKNCRFWLFYFTLFRLLIIDQSFKAYFHHGCLYPRHLAQWCAFMMRNHFMQWSVPSQRLLRILRAVKDSIRKGPSNWT